LFGKKKIKKEFKKIVHWYSAHIHHRNTHFAWNMHPNVCTLSLPRIELGSKLRHANTPL
jgi:hypothetical protein